MSKKVRKNFYLTIGFVFGFIIAITLTTNAESQLASESVGYDNSISGSTKTNVKDAIDELYEKANNIEKCPDGKVCLEQCTGNNCKCKRATTLHTEKCNNGSSDNQYCYADGYTIGDTVTYGSLGISGTLTSGDAFDCDVNGDGIYDSSTERFYYVTDLSSDSNYAVLIYYNNVSSGKASNSTSYAYDSSGTNNNGPVTAIKQLPTTTQWSNVSLLNTKRAITTGSGGIETSAGTLPTAFSYAGYAARLITYQEVNTGCYDGTTAISKTGGLSRKCQYLMENTKYTNSNYTYGTWLETPGSSSTISVNDVYASIRAVKGNSGNSSIYVGVRPAIEVLKSDIDY
jgi:hypothetical protein